MSYFDWVKTLAFVAFALWLLYHLAFTYVYVKATRDGEGFVPFAVITGVLAFLNLIEAALYFDALWLHGQLAKVAVVAIFVSLIARMALHSVLTIWVLHSPPRRNIR